MPTHATPSRDGTDKGGDRTVEERVAFLEQALALHGYSLGVLRERVKTAEHDALVFGIGIFYTILLVTVVTRKVR
jgi:hypothetical protein